MNKKILISSLSIFMMTTALLTDNTSATDINNKKEKPIIEEVNKENIEDSYLTTSNWARNIGVKAVFAALNKSSQYVFNRDPSISYGSTRDTASSGTIHFNQGTQNIASVKKSVEVVKKGHQVELWANSNNLLYTGKIVVLLTTPGGTDVINKSVGHNQYSWYSATGTGTHQARYVTSNKDSWNLWQAYYHWGDLASSYTGCTEYSVPIKNYSTFTNDNGEIVTFENIDGKKHIVSENSREKNNSLTKTNSLYTFEELYHEFFDEKLELLTDVAKNIKENDIVILKDNISSIMYDHVNNETELIFYTKFGEQPIRFAGDLTKKYKAGDKISLKFVAQKIYPTKDYISFNYKKEIEQNEIAPNIEDYILDY